MRSTLIKAAMVVTATAALAAAGVAPAANAVTTVVTLGPSQVDLSQSRANGHNDFTGDGLHIYTDGNTDTGDNGSGGTWNTDKAAGYWDCSSMKVSDLGDGPTLDVYYHDLSLPGGLGSQTNVSLNGDGVVDGTLVGETVYNGDFWLANSDTAMQADAPVVGGGSGSQWHGTMAQWAASLPATATVTQCGYSLGSGVHGDVELKSATWGNTTFEFSKNVAPTPPTKVTPVGQVTATHGCRTASVVVSVHALGPNQVASPKTVYFRETDNGKTAHSATLKPGTSSTWNTSYPYNKGKHVIKVFKSGVLMMQFTVQTKC